PAPVVSCRTRSHACSAVDADSGVPCPRRQRLVEPPAVDMPAGSIRVHDEIVLVRAGATPYRNDPRGRQTHALVTCLPGAETTKMGLGARRQRFTDAPGLVAGSFEDHDVAAGARQVNGCRTSGRPAA